MVTPVLFLDIDGVLNAFDSTTWGDNEDHWVSPYDEQRSFLLSLSPKMGKAIMDLGVDILWTTTWQQSAHLVGDLIGVQAMGVLDLNHPGWKREAVDRYLADTPRPFLWFEDEPGVYGTDNARKGLPEPHLVINPNPNVGITPYNIEQAQEFLAGL